MNISQLHEQYLFHDGSINSFRLDIINNNAEIELQVQRIISKAPSGQIQDNDLVPCTLRITFFDLINISLFNNFPTQGYYLNFSTYSDGNGVVGISLNVHDSSSYVYEEDNWTIKAKSISWEEV